MNKSRVFVLFGISFVLLLCLVFMPSDLIPNKNIILGEYTSSKNNFLNNFEGKIN